MLLLGIAVLLSSNRRAIRLRIVGAAFALQVSIATLVLYVPAGRAALQGVRRQRQWHRFEVVI
jgi:CNT family concentrative nucleoside transporter